MIVFIKNAEDYKEAHKKYDGIFIVASDDLKVKKIDMDGTQFLPPPDIISQFMEDGDIELYGERYKHYLSDPRVRYLLSLAMFRSIGTDVFVVSSETECKDYLYPSFMKDFMVNNTALGKDYCISYKKYKKLKKIPKYTTEIVSWIENDLARFANKSKEARELCEEM